MKMMKYLPRRLELIMDYAWTNITLEVLLWIVGKEILNYVHQTDAL